MTSESIVTCPICENENFSPHIKARDYTVTKEVFELKKCTHCGFIITSPRPTAESIEKYYASDDYISHSGKSKNIFDKIYLAARNITLSWKHELIKDYFPNPGEILDFGCGTGEFLSYMKNKNWRVNGVEPNGAAREKANHLLDNRVAPDLKLIKENTMEVITLWHVLEHIHDLTSTIQRLKSLLTINGHIFIAVPNPNSHDCEHYKNDWAGYDVPRHLWHFTQETMSALLSKNGLNIVNVKPMKLDSYYVSLLSEGYKNPNQLKLLRGMKAFAEGCVSNFSARRNNEYSSLIYIAKTK